VFWRAYRFEIIWLFVVAVGIFLVFEQMSVRATLAGWFRQVASSLLGDVVQGYQRFDAFLSQTSTSDVVGFALICAATFAIFARIRSRLRNTPALAELRCPRCGDGLHRIHRKPLDRLISVYVPVRRYHCRSDRCGWKGLRIGDGRVRRISKEVSSAV